jgi:four helix bundle protein
MFGMHNPKSSSILEHSLEVVEMARPLVEAIQRRDRDLASQLRRAISSVALNLAEGFGCTAGSARARFETARGSLNEAHAGIRVAVAWRYVSQDSVDVVLKSMHSLGGRVFGLVRR